MNNHRRLATTALALALIAICAAPTVEAGGSVGFHIGSAGFGVSIGFGDWGVYTTSWSDPYWSIDYNAVLAGYGEWVWIDGLGRVWRPWVAASWRPFTYGRWVSTTFGWTWVAYEPWGYVPHHYGSWAFSAFGWVWVPSYSYSCANVVWVRAGGYVGWYARPPWGWSHASHGYVHGYQHGYNDGWKQGYGSGYSDGWNDARYGTFVEWKNFGSDNVSRHAVSHRIASTNRFDASVSAPTGAELRRHGGREMAETRLEHRTVKVDGRDVTIARPVGVTESIERNAADAVSRALSGRALEQRQPLVKPHTENSAATARASRSSGVLREVRTSVSNRSSTSQQTDTSSRTARSAASLPSSDRRSSRTESSRTVVDTQSTGIRDAARQPATELRRSSPRGAAEFGNIESRGLGRSSSAKAPVRSAAEPQHVQPSRQVITSRQTTRVTSRQPATTTRRPAPSPKTTAESRQSTARDDDANGSSKDRSSSVPRPARRSRTDTR